MNDPVGDMLTRLRNAVTARHETVEIPASHVAMVSHPDEVADLIEKAAESVGTTAVR